MAKSSYRTKEATKITPAPVADSRLNTLRQVETLLEEIDTLSLKPGEDPSEESLTDRRNGVRTKLAQVARLILGEMS
jgi:hypothetical protein